MSLVRGFVSMLGGQAKRAPVVPLVHAKRRLGQITAEEFQRRVFGGEAQSFATPDTQWVTISSDAIRRARFNPDKPRQHGGLRERLGLGAPDDMGLLWVTYVNGKKDYAFRCPRSVWDQFMKSPSKGQYTQYVLRKYYRLPGF